MDNPPPGSTQATTPDPQPLPASLLAKGRDLAYRIAVDGSVLLRNRAGALPLNTRDTRSIAVLGEGAGRLVEGFGADSTSTPSRITTVLGSVTARASRGVRVTHVAGMDAVRPGDNLPGNNAVPSGVLRPASGTGNGLSAQWFANPTFSGAPLVSRTEDQVNWGNALTALFETFGYETSPAPDVPTPFVAIPNPSIRWTGSLHPTATGRYSLGVTVLGHANLWIDGRQVLSVAANTLTTRSANLDLVAGRSYSVQIDYVADAPNQCCATSGGIGPAIRFSWVPPNAQASPQIQAAVRAARAADVAVVVANDEMGESLDRGSLRLQQNQDLLIQAVARANPNTIVVLMTGAPVVMPWLNQVAGVFESWYPGQEQGRAIAALLFGDEGFAGKLPVSWPRSEQQVTQGLGIQNPIYAVNKPGVNVPYNERIYVGYRGYDQKNLTPLFPFGYGLTYDRFRYRDIRLVDPVLPAAGRPGHAGLVRVRVQNRGDHRGTEIVQVYSGRLPTSAATPPRQLAGWARVTLAAGQTRWVDIPIPLNTPQHLLAYFNASTNRWVTPTGRVGIYVGSSERDIRLMGNFTVRTAR
jgi:beta-glucosidase